MSSTEAELFGVSDGRDATAGLVDPILYRSSAQGYNVTDNVIFQDKNQSASLSEKNGRASSSKRTRYINILYFFVTRCQLSMALQKKCWLIF